MVCMQHQLPCQLHATPSGAGPAFYLSTRQPVGVPAPQLVAWW
jgi:hypothetical protein